MLFGAVGALIAGTYGIIHDQITFWLGPEYFTKFKFVQFHYLDTNAPAKLTVAKIGFLATWWVGFFAAWFMGRVTLPHLPLRVAARRCLRGVGLMMFIAFVFAFTAFWLAPTSLEDSRFDYWRPMLIAYSVDHPLEFVRVAYIHNASYLGGFIGLVISLFVLWRYCRSLKRNRGETESFTSKQSFDSVA